MAQTKPRKKHNYKVGDYVVWSMSGKERNLAKITYCHKPDTYRADINYKNNIQSIGLTESEIIEKANNFEILRFIIKGE